MPKSTSPINRLALFTTVLCADVLSSTPNLQPQNSEVKDIVFVHAVSGADRSGWRRARNTIACTMINLRHYAPHHDAIALVRPMQKPWPNDTHLRSARLVAPTHPVS
jgi:hypothetical protein